MKKPRLIRTGARAATKVQEKELFDKAKLLADKPELLLPECIGSCWLCPFKRLKKKLLKISKFKDNKKKLMGYADSGEETAMAYASLLLLPHSERAMFLGVAKTPYGNVAFARRGKAKKEKLIGVQYFDNQNLRLMYILDYVKKRKLHIYSLKDKLVCSGKVGKPPKEFIDDVISVCKHSKNATTPLLQIDIGGYKFKRCSLCVKDGKNTFINVFSKYASPSPKKEFDVNADIKLNCKSKCEKCILPESFISKEEKEKYFKGELNDAQLLNMQIEEFRNKAKEKGILMIGDECYGKNEKEFVFALGCNEEEKVAIIEVLSSVGGIFIEEKSPGKLISMYWQDYGKDMLKRLVCDENLAKDILKKFGKLTPTQILKEAIEEKRRISIVSSLPKYSELSIHAKFCDELAKVYRMRGADEILRIIDREHGKDIKINAIAFAFLLALGKEGGKEWKYDKVETELGIYLKEYAKKLLECLPEEYNNALQALLHASGLIERLVSL
ncbi:MAG: hypothetical protein AB1779_05075 [Candidatus Thermoplasmatota archaeon]